MQKGRANRCPLSAPRESFHYLLPLHSWVQDFKIRARCFFFVRGSSHFYVPRPSFLLPLTCTKCTNFCFLGADKGQEGVLRSAIYLFLRVPGVRVGVEFRLTSSLECGWRFKEPPSPWRECSATRSTCGRSPGMYCLCKCPFVNEGGKKCDDG